MSRSSTCSRRAASWIWLHSSPKPYAALFRASLSLLAFSKVAANEYAARGSPMAINEEALSKRWSLSPVWTAVSYSPTSDATARESPIRPSTKLAMMLSPT